MSSMCCVSHKHYRSAFKVGRILYRVATLLLRSLMTKSLIEYFWRGSALQIILLMFSIQVGCCWRLQKTTISCINASADTKTMNKPCYDNSAESADLLIIIAAALQRIVTFTFVTQTLSCMRSKLVCFPWCCYSQSIAVARTAAKA